MKDAFGADIDIGSLVTYFMKPKNGGGNVYVVGRIISQSGTGWPIIELDKDWVKKYNEPYEAQIEQLKNGNKDAFGEKALEFQFFYIRANMIEVTKRKVAPQSLIRIDTHPSFKD